ncbi:MAG TPA: glycine zipper domain-containing protein [Longimicrobium sp.]
MRVLKIAVMMSAVVAIAACGNDAELRPAAPSNDLTWLDSLGVSDAAPVNALVSPTEMGAAATDSAANTLAVAAPVKEPEAKAASSSSTKRSSARRSSSSSRRSSGSSASSSGSGSYESAPTYRAPRVTTVRHTKRDAIIGAGAGAVVGAVAGGSRHRVRGAVVGAVVGGAAGGLFGHHVDKRTRVEP